MVVNTVIIFIMLGFMAWAAIDKYFLNNRFGYGEKFDDAFSAMGPLALAIVGIMCLAPVLGQLLTPVFTPLYHLFGADPAMLAGSIFASDTGGLALAKQMSTDPDIHGLSGILLGSMMGIAIIFVIPYTSTVVDAADRPFLSKGILSGIIAVPVGCLIGGLVAGIPVGKLLVNLILVAVLALVLALALWFAPNITVKAFSVFAKVLSVIIGMALVVAIISGLTGYAIVPGMAPIEDQFIVVGMIASMLAGAYPFIHFITTVFEKPLLRLGKAIGVNSVAIAGMLASLASAIPMYPMIKDMDERGKVMSVAFSVCAGFCLGDILGFTAANMPEYIFPMIVGKLAAGVLATAIGALLAGNRKVEAAPEEAAAVREAE